MTNPKIKDGNSAILLASWNGHNDMIKFLLEKVMHLPSFLIGKSNIHGFMPLFL